jgi:hypothetical protein
MEGVDMGNVPIIREGFDRFCPIVLIQLFEVSADDQETRTAKQLYEAIVEGAT